MNKSTPKSYINSIPVRDRILTPQPLGLDIINLGYNELPFQPTKKIAEELSKLPNPFETAPTTEVKTTKKIVTEKRSVSFARKFYQKGEK